MIPKSGNYPQNFCIGLLITAQSAQPLKPQDGPNDLTTASLLSEEIYLPKSSDRKQTVNAHQTCINAKVSETLPTATLETPVSESAKIIFRPTIQFGGEALYSISGVMSESSGTGPENGYRLRLNLDTSFTGRDRLRIRLQSIITPRPNLMADTDLARLSFQGDNGGQFELTRAQYIFALGRRSKIYIEGVGGSLNDFADTLSPYVSGSGKGALSRFGQRNPIYRQGEGAGLGFTHEFNNRLSFGAGYLTSFSLDPSASDSDNGYSAIAQLTYRHPKDIDIGLTYVHSYNSLDTNTGSAIANDPFDNTSKAIRANSLGLQTNFKLNPRLALGGWVGYTQATAIDLPGSPQASMYNWAVTVAFPDLGKKGNLGALIIGQPPQTFHNSFQVDNNDLVDSGNTLQLEAFYRIQLQKNLELTFGGWVVANPDVDSDSSPLFVGAVRTTFRF